MEMSILLARASFRAGHISLLPVVFDRSSKDGSALPVFSSTFLDALPAFTISSCLQQEPKRSVSVNFTDLLPDDPLEDAVRELLALGTKNADDKMLWLLTGTRKPTEFGITKGSPKISLDEPVSLLETLRSLLVLRCLPPPSAKEAVLSAQSSDGSRGRRALQDFLSGLPRTTTFVSRTLYRAQDHEREFDLSLLTYAPHLLQRKPQSPDASISVEDASDLLSSAFLNLLVHQTVLTPQEAENKAQELAMALKRAFLGDDLSSSRTLPLTRRMLLQFLATVIHRDDAKANVPSLGEVWWKRIEE